MNKTRIITIGGTFLCALGVGYLMQNAVSDQPAPGVSAEPATRADFKPLSEPALAPDIRPEPDTAQAVDTTQVADQAIPAPALEATPQVSVQVVSTDESNAVASQDYAALDVTSSDPEPAPAQAEPEPLDLTCEVTSTAAADAGAMVRLEVEAPCFANERVVVHHNGMMFTDTTDDNGMIKVMVPALAETAVMIVEFENGEGSVATTEVSSLSFYDRVVLQWTGDAGFQLHAREYGATYGEAGHVWTGAARSVTSAALGEGGFVTTLGAPDTLAPRMVEVYSFPTGTAGQSGDIALSVEAEVTAANCGRDIEAQSMELKADGSLHTQYLTLAVPDCGAIGDFLVLNNLVDDLKIAAN